MAAGIEPLEIEQWLKLLKQREKFENPTLHKTRSVMSLVYKSAQRYGLISREREANPLCFVRCQTQSEYEAINCSLEQVRLILSELERKGRHLERLLALVAIATGLRISECLGLQWQDVDYAGQQIFIRRTWIRGNVGKPKTKASKATVPMHMGLAMEMRQWQNQTPWAGKTDWVFASARMNGKQPLTANILVEDHLRQAAARAGVLQSKEVSGEIVDADPRRFGFHNLRHSLASFLVTKTGTDLKTVQDVMRHADAKTTIDEYTHSSPEERLAAQAQVLALLKPEHVERVQ